VHAAVGMVAEENECIHQFLCFHFRLNFLCMSRALFNFRCRIIGFCHDIENRHNSADSASEGLFQKAQNASDLSEKKSMKIQ
jgi:hypothetical protein